MQRLLRRLQRTIHGLSASAAEAIFQHSEQLHLMPGQWLFRAGETKSVGMYIVVDGLVGVYEPVSDSDAMSRAQGQRQPLCIFGSGQTLGENALLAGPGETWRVSARVIRRRSSILKIDFTTLHWLLRNRPGQMVSFVLHTTARQWKVARFALGEHLHPEAALPLAIEPPSKQAWLSGWGLDDAAERGESLALAAPDGASGGMHAAQGSSPPGRRRSSSADENNASSSTGGIRERPCGAAEGAAGHISVGLQEPARAACWVDPDTEPGNFERVAKAAWRRI